MTRRDLTWDALSPQPFDNHAAVYTYIPRRDDQPQPSHVTKPMLQPMYSNSHHLNPQAAVYYPLYSHAHPWYQYHHPQPAFYLPPNHYYTPSQYHSSQPQPQPQPGNESASDTTHRLANGTRPWYGRTQDEVRRDELRMGEHLKYEKKLKKDFEPKGAPSDVYWVQHKDGGQHSYPLGTIKNNFTGEWKSDTNAYPYLVEN